MAWPKPVPAPVMNQTGVEDIILLFSGWFRDGIDCNDYRILNCIYSSRGRGVFGVTMEET